MSRLRSSLLHYAQGLLMGSADVVPGVSGGTMALIVGIYERLVSALSSAFSFVLSVLRLRWAEARRHWWEIDWALILPLGLGIVSAIVLASAFIPALLDAYPQQMRGLFFGLVAASIAVPWLRMGRFTPGLLALAVLAAVAAFLVTGLPTLADDPSPALPRVFASAAVAICAMILPGVSGAFLLEALGIYRPTLEALRSAFGLDGGSLLYVAVFIAGAAIGLGLFAKLLDCLLARYPNRTMAVLIGLMAGALRALWPWLDGRQLQWPGAGDPVGSVLALGLIGFAFVAVLTWLGAAQLRQDSQPAS